MKMHLFRAAAPLAAVALCAAAATAEARMQQSECQSGDDRQSRFEESSQTGRSSSHSRWAQISGEIERIKKVDLRGARQEHLAAVLTTERGRRIIADLGPSKDLRDLELRSGDWITVRGPVVRVNDRRVLFAQQIQADGQTIRIKRQESSQQSQPTRHESQQVSGQVQDVKELKVKGMEKKHQVVRLKTQDGRQIIADLGAKKELRDLSIKSGQQLTVQGPMFRVSGKPFLIAEQVSTDGRTAKIDRQFMSAMPGSQDRTAKRGTQSISGEVIVKGEVLRLDRDGFYVVRDPSGREVHFLVAENMNRGFSVGDQIEAQVKPDGSVTSISKSSGGQSSGRSTQSSGSSMQSSQR